MARAAFSGLLFGLVLWLWSGAAPARSWGLLGACALPGLLLACGPWGRAVAPLELIWDGALWSLGEVGSEMPAWLAEGAPLVLFDAQALLLLRLRPGQAGGVRWLLLRRRSAPARWHLLRCAVYSRAVFEPPRPA